MSKANKHKTNVLVVTIKWAEAPTWLAFADFRYRPELDRHGEYDLLCKIPGRSKSDHSATCVIFIHSQLLRSHLAFIIHPMRPSRPTNDHDSLIFYHSPFCYDPIQSPKLSKVCPALHTSPKPSNPRAREDKSRVRTQFVARKEGQVQFLALWSD